MIHRFQQLLCALGFHQWGPWRDGKSHSEHLWWENVRDCQCCPTRQIETMSPFGRHRRKMKVDD